MGATSNWMDGKYDFGIQTLDVYISEPKNETLVFNACTRFYKYKYMSLHTLNATNNQFFYLQICYSHDQKIKNIQLSWSGLAFILLIFLYVSLARILYSGDTFTATVREAN